MIDPVLTAGGLLERTDEDGRVRIAIVHRTRYRDRSGAPGDWVLPKGGHRPAKSDDPRSGDERWSASWPLSSVR